MRKVITFFIPYVYIHPNKNINNLCRIKSLDDCNKQMQSKHIENISQLEKTLSDAQKPKETTTIGIQADKDRTLSTTNAINESRKGAMERMRSHYQQKMKEMKKRHEEELRDLKSRIPQSNLKSNRSTIKSLKSPSSYTSNTNNSRRSKGIQVNDTVLNDGNVKVGQSLTPTVSSDIMESTITTLTSQLEHVTVALKSFLYETVQDEDIAENNQQSLSNLLSKLKYNIENKDITINELQKKVIQASVLLL